MDGIPRSDINKVAAAYIPNRSDMAYLAGLFVYAGPMRHSEIRDNEGVVFHGFLRKT